QTPIIYDAETFVTSGHFPKYEDLMFKLEVDERPWAMKAMNCPGHMLLFGSQIRSYRDLPIRYAEPAPLHRNELTGTLHGLLRVRRLTQDDAHIFCTEEQIQDEIADVVDYARTLYELFELKASAELCGSYERFIGILIEHYAGVFPFWLAPVQIRVIPVGEDHRGPAHELEGKLSEYRIEVDERDETVGKRIRDSEVEKIPVTIVY